MFINTSQKYVENGEQAFEEAVNHSGDHGQESYEELIKFIDEFISSEEYSEYIRNKKNIIKRCMWVQYDENDLKEFPQIVEDKYPQTTESKKLFAFAKQFEKYVKRKENLEILRRQKHGIQIIKDKISKLKVFLNCTRKTKQARYEKNCQKYLETFCDTFNINYNSLKIKDRRKVEERIICYQKIIHSRTMKRKMNITSIVRKLTEEYGRKPKKSIWNIPRQTDFYQAERRQMSSGEMHHVSIVADIFNETDNETVERGDEESQKDIKKNKQEYKVTKVKNKKENEINSAKRSKKGKKSSKKEQSELVLPVVPLCNRRNKIDLESKERISQLLEEFRKFDNIMEDKHMLSQEVSSADIMIDNNFLCKPGTIIFESCEYRKKYKKKCIILNKSKQPRKFRLLKISSQNEYDTLLFEIQPLLGIQKVSSGCSVTLYVTFIPREPFTQLEAKLEFLSYDVEDQQYQQFFVHIRCLPPHANLKISQSDISFGKMFIWQARLSMKSIRLKNEGKKACKAVIKKIFDPLELTDLLNNENEYQNLFEDITKNIVEDLFENVFNTFSFGSCFIEVDGSENFKLEIKMKNVDHVGDFLEKYMLDVYEDGSFVGSQELLVSAEIRGHFIELSPEVLDFGVCIFNSIYQLGLDIYNSSSCTQTIAVKFPSSVVDYIKSDVTNLYVPPQTKRTVWIKFLPRKHITTERIHYFDGSTGILEMPVHICILSRNYSAIPPIKATIFAVLSDQNNTNIIPTEEANCDYFPDGAVLDLGECSIYEIVYTDIIIENETSSPQIYGFIDLPQCITISPNFGFGELDPGEKKTLKIYFHPNIEDIKDCYIEGKLKDHRKVLKLTLETLSNVGQIKQSLNGKKLRKSIDLMIQEMRNSLRNNNLLQDIKICMKSVKSVYFSQKKTYDGQIHVLRDYKGEGCNEFVRSPPKNVSPEETITKRQVTVHAKIIRPLLEISSQHVEFPDTPCGSYSTAEIELRALENEIILECDFLKNNSKLLLPNYEAWFKITGDNEQIRIEPSCGILKKGEAKKIILIAKPSTLDHVIKDTAKAIKYSEIYEMKKREIELARSRSQLKKKSSKALQNVKGSKKSVKQRKDKKNDKKKGLGKQNTGIDLKSTERTVLPEITITDEELEISYLDYYPAEMFYWRSLEPYTLKSKLVCNINYDSPNMIRKQETIYLDVFCKVIRPDFITNLKQQRINFGTTAVGMVSTEYIILQNIKYSAIKPKISLLNPVGPFRVPHLRNWDLPPENYLKLPIKFEPRIDEKVEEYFEISSGETILPLILEGTGILPDLEFKPNVLVYRLDTKSNKVAECDLEILNKCCAVVTIHFEKVLELEGTMITESIGRDDKSSTLTQKSNTKQKSKTPEKTKIPDERTKKSLPLPKCFDKLTIMEETSIKDRFKTRKGESFFDILNIENNQVQLPGNSEKVVKFCFGTPEALLKRKKELTERDNKKKKEKFTEKSGSGKSKDGKKVADIMYYLAKYNIKLGNSFVRDVILICYFK
nr:uncharacterized protein LOC111507668 isoform X1 [Leptinotarsa decemlineata]